MHIVLWTAKKGPGTKILHPGLVHFPPISQDGRLQLVTKSPPNVSSSFIDDLYVSISTIGYWQSILVVLVTHTAIVDSK